MFAQRVVRVAGARRFTTSAVSRADQVQDIYLKHLRQFKPTPAAKDAHVGVVREFSSPAPPKAVAVPAGSELAKELETYEAGSPADASASSQQTSTSASAEEHQGETAEDFLEGLKADQKVEAHH